MITRQATFTSPPSKAIKYIKCIVWDLDNTIWDGILLEGEDVALRPGIIDIITTLDERGILHSIASRNDQQAAERKLEQLGLREYFLYPQINWGVKSSSIQTIAKELNLGIDAFLFVDDQPFEREEVEFALPGLRCHPAEQVETLLSMPELMPPVITEDAKQRRVMYKNDGFRKDAEQSFEGPTEAFLRTLDMEFCIAPAHEEDLLRAEELTVRTHQLNTTGNTYSLEELDAFRQADDHLLLITSLHDKYGSYGKIGLALVEKGVKYWRLKLILMSCRVMSRGVGSIMLAHIMQMAREANVRLRADFRVTDRNRMMYVTYKFIGFQEVEQQGEYIILEHDLQHIPAIPDYVQVHVENS